MNAQPSTPRIVVLDGYTLNPGDISWSTIEALGNTTIYDRTPLDKVVSRCIDADIVLTNKVPLREDVLQQLPRLKYIGVLATGYNIIDLEAASRQGIVVTNIPAYSTTSVVQLVFAHLLNISNRVQLHSDSVRRGDWASCHDFSYILSAQTELYGKTIGIVGFGNIGSAVAAVAHALGMRVVALTSKSADKLPAYVTPLSLDELLATSDVVSLHCPLTDKTHHLINSQTLGQMKEGAILINTGRGPLLDEQAVADALNSGRLAALGADVLSSEPPSADNPLLTARNCYITPHIAWATREARLRLMQIETDNIAAFIAGAPINQVNA